jgi:DNA-binding MarR family transcriptional regulator
MKDLNRETKLLFNYIQEKSTEENPWVILKHRDIPTIARTSSFYSRRLLELLKLHPNLISEVDFSYNTHMKPYKFRVVDEEEKLKKGLSENQFPYLDRDNIERVMDVCNLADYYEAHKMLSVINYMAGAGANKQFVKFDLKEIGGVLGIEESTVVSMVDKFLQAGCLVKAKQCDAYRLTFSDEELVETALQAESQKPPVKVPGKKKKGASAPAALLPEAGFAKNELQEYSVGGLIVALKEFAHYFDEGVTSVVNQHIAADANLSESHIAMTKLLDELSQLRQSIENLEHDNRRLSGALEKKQSYYSEFQQRAQGRVEVLYAEILQLLAEFGKIPKWKNDEENSGAFQRRVVTVLNDAISEILSVKEDGGD